MMIRKLSSTALLLLAAAAASKAEEYVDPALAAAPVGVSAAAADYYREAPQDRVYIQNRDGSGGTGHGAHGGGGGHGGGVGYGAPQTTYYTPQYQHQQDPLIPNLYPTAILGGLGCLGMAYFKHVIDQSYNKSLHAFEQLHHNVDHRLEHLEEMINNDQKSNKKLDFKTKALCKFANLFNNPTYEICNQGFDGGQVIGPTGAAHSGFSHLGEETDGPELTGTAVDETGDGTGSSDDVAPTIENDPVSISNAFTANEDTGFGQELEQRF